MLGDLAALGAALAWAIGSLVIKPISGRYSPLSINSLRNGTAWLVLVAVLLPWGKMSGLSGVPWHSIGFILASGLISLVVGTTLYIKSLGLLRVSVGYAISYSSWLLFVAIIAALFLDEPITLFTLLGTVFIVFGITVLSWRPQGVAVKSQTRADELKGTIFAVLCGFCWAIGTAFVKVGLYEVDPLLANVVRLPLIALLLGVLVLKRQGVSGFKQYTRRAVVLAGVGGIFDQAVASVLFFISVRLAGVAKATILSSTSPLFVVPLALVFLKEPFTWRTGLGTAACVGGIWLTVL